jgi:hypothetical protein
MRKIQRESMRSPLRAAYPKYAQKKSNTGKEATERERQERFK